MGRNLIPRYPLELSWHPRRKAAVVAHQMQGYQYFGVCNSQPSVICWTASVSCMRIPDCVRSGNRLQFRLGSSASRCSTRLRRRSKASRVIPVPRMKGLFARRLVVVSSSLHQFQPLPLHRNQLRPREVAARRGRTKQNEPFPSKWLTTVATESMLALRVLPANASAIDS